MVPNRPLPDDSAAVDDLAPVRRAPPLHGRGLAQRLDGPGQRGRDLLGVAVLAC